MEYCYKINNPNKIKFNRSELKEFITKLYIGKKEPKYTKDEKTPFIVIDIQDEDNNMCIKMTSVAKKHITRIENIHTNIKTAQLKWKDSITLSKPFVYKLDTNIWWDNDVKNKGKKWNSLIQRGPYFGHLLVPYKFLGASLSYEGKKYKLLPKEEKVASFYAKRIISEKAGGVVEELTKDNVFNTNFWKDFKKYLTAEHLRVFKDFNKIGWNDLVRKIEQEKEKGLTEEEKINKKIENAEKERIYGYAILDGKKEKLANYAVEPAGIFMGRGKQPNRGKIKKEVFPEDVILNIGKNDPKPKPPKGHKWGGFVNDYEGTWLAKWKDSITGDMKYVRFSMQGKFKGMSDLEKYEKARKLEKHITFVREKYMIDAASNNPIKKQLGTVLWLIDHHGIRVGGEKGTDEADTVGASTLRVEHVKLKEPDLVIFDFLGKDSIRFYKEIKVPKLIYNNFIKLTSGKKGTTQVFNAISSTGINDYLKEIDGSFTAKVFRTRLASSIMFNALKTVKIPKNATKQLIKTLFNKANAKVAEILNHTRSVSKKAKESVKKDEEKLKEAKQELKLKKKEGKSIEAVTKKIENIKLRIQQKTDVLAIAITTSLTNYIDPRLVISWAKSQDVELSNIYTKTLLTKFQWADEMTDKNWNWENAKLMIVGDNLDPTKVEGTGEMTSGEDSARKIKPSAPKNQGTKKDYKILLKICENPDKYRTEFYNISKDAMTWIYPFALYARNKGITNKAIDYIIKYYKAAYVS
jgi:DNA topoisomerase-1